MLLNFEALVARYHLALKITENEEYALSYLVNSCWPAIQEPETPREPEPPIQPDFQVHMSGPIITSTPHEQREQYRSALQMHAERVHLYNEELYRYPNRKRLYEEHREANKLTLKKFFEEINHKYTDDVIEECKKIKAEELSKY